MKSTTSQINSVAAAAKTILIQEQSEISQALKDSSEEVYSFASEFLNLKDLSTNIEELRKNLVNINKVKNVNELEDNLNNADAMLDTVMDDVEPLLNACKLLRKELDKTFAKLDKANK